MKSVFDNDGGFRPGMLVRLIGDPQQIGAFQDALTTDGRAFARVQFATGIRRVPFDQLEPVPTAPEEPLDFLRSGRLSEPRRLRQVLTHIRLTGRLADMIYSMEATNTEFHAHQFKPVLKMLGSPTGSLLIADEVGLGKTIEAGLIWTELRARFDYRNLLVICPKVLCTKWEAELSGKFGLDPRIVGAADLLRAIRDRERLGRERVMIGSLQALQPPRGWDDEGPEIYRRASAELARLLKERGEDEPVFDLLVIDEAHHLRNPATQRNLLARLLQPLAHHRVFLSATPIHLRNRDLFSLLTLLDPETFRSERDFDDILSANRPLITAREAALRGSSKAEILRLIEAAASHHLLRDSQQIVAIRNESVNLPDPLPRSDRATLADRLEQVNLLANVVNRTRRRDVQELRVVRRVFVHSEPMSDRERAVYDRITAEIQAHAFSRSVSAGFLSATPQRLLSSCLPAAVDHWRKRRADLEVEDEEDPDDEPTETVGPLVERLAALCRELPDPETLAREDTKFARFSEVLEQFLREHPGEKIVVFSTFRPTLRYLARRLGAAGFGVELIHGDVPDREAVLGRFAPSASARVLLSSEVGSEGLDLQFCRAVVNYDLPWNPMRVEQRIGRVDRLGQRAEIVSVINLLSAGTIDDRIYTRLYERLDLCRHALGEFEAVLGEEIRKLTTDLLSKNLTPEEQNARIDQTSQAIETKKRIVEELEDEAAALIAHGDHILRSIHAAHEQNRWIGAKDLFNYIRDTLNTVFPGCSIRDLDDGSTYELILSSTARLAYSGWLSDRRYPRGSRLEREAGPVPCMLGRPSSGKLRWRGIEAITQAHPFVRFLAERLGQTDAPKLRPAVAGRLGHTAINAKVAPGRYVVMADLWRFGGQVEHEKIAYVGFSLADGELIADDDAEMLLISTAEHGTHRVGVDGEVDLEEVGLACDEVLAARLNELFWAEKTARQAEQEDRASIQLRTLERRLNEQAGGLREQIQRQRKEQRVRGSIIAANEGRLRALEERAATRRAAIERTRSITAQQEALVAVIVEIIP